jgi:hypothetical protein
MKNSPPSTALEIKLRRMRRKWYVRQMGDMRHENRFLSENLMGRGHLRDVGTERGTLLNRILKKSTVKMLAGFIRFRSVPTSGNL